MSYSRLIEVDITNVIQKYIPSIVQGSVNELLQIKLKNHGKLYNLTDCQIIYEIIKPDGHVCNGLMNITVPNNGFGNIQLTKQALSSVGICKINLSIIRKNEEIKVNGLKYEVTPGESEVVSWSETLVDLPVVFGKSTYNVDTTLNKWHDFVGIPDNSIGTDGDYGLQLPSCDIWKKQLGYWERCGNIKGEKGDNGEDAVGLPGKDGVTPNFTIGKVTTIDPGYSAKVTITGTSENPILNLEIPKGDKFAFNDFTESQLEMLKVKGDKGSTWYDGSGKPQIELGNERDYYLDTTTSDIYVKVRDIWERIGNIGSTLDSVNVSELQRKTDNALKTEDKTIVGAINEIKRQLETTKDIDGGTF